MVVCGSGGGDGLAAGGGLRLAVHITARALGNSGGGMTFEHDAAGGSNDWPVMLEGRTICSAGVRDAARVVGAAHEEQGIDGVLFGLLAGHTQNAGAWCSWSSRGTAQVAIVSSLGGS